MADTQQTIADMLAALADNCSGDITPQVLRDLVLTLQGSVGFMYMSATAQTPIGTPGEYVKGAGTTTSVFLRNFTHANNRLTYTGDVPIQAFIIAPVAISIASGSNDLCGIQLAKNDVVIPHSELKRLINSSPDVGALASLGSVELTTNDYIEMWVANHTQAVNIIIQYMQMFILGTVK